MAAKQHKYTAQFKAKVVLEVLRYVSYPFYVVAPLSPSQLASVINKRDDRPN
jgi:hypothetical protein